MRHLISSAVAISAFVMSAGAQVPVGTYANFDVPGAQTTNPTATYFVGTIVEDMNNQGQVIGWYSSDSSISSRGFMRDAKGVIHLIDDPSAGTPVAGGAKTLAYTGPAGINDAGVIVGTSNDAIGRINAFIRATDGTIQDFKYQAGYPESASAINAKGQIAAEYGTGTHWIGMIWNPDATSISFSAPDASAAQAFMGTYVTSINNLGDVVGWYYDSNGTVHSYVRTANGTLTEFSAPGAGTNPWVGTWALRIFDSGAILGGWIDNSYNGGDYIRLPNGSFLPVVIPPGSGFLYLNINDIDWWGDVLGTYTDAGGVDHVFYRTRDGVSYVFTDPAAGTAKGQGTQGIRMNAWGDVAGRYIDANNITHGLVWKPFAK